MTTDDEIYEFSGFVMKAWANACKLSKIDKDSVTFPLATFDSGAREIIQPISFHAFGKQQDIKITCTLEALPFVGEDLLIDVIHKQIERLRLKHKIKIWENL